jgi:hypothetical protein
MKSLNLFSTAAPVVKKTEKREKETRAVKPNVQKLINQFRNLYNEHAEAKAELDMVKDDLKVHCKSFMLQEFEDTDVCQGSLLFGKEGSKVMVTMKAQYPKIDEARHDHLNATYGDIADKETVFSINPAMLKKHGEAISAAIMASKAIPKADKAKIFQADTKYFVKKNVLDRLASFDEPLKVIEEVQPIISLKHVG